MSGGEGAAHTTARREAWAVCLVPLLAAGLAVGAWFAWRWWTAPQPFVCYEF